MSGLNGDQMSSRNVIMKICPEVGLSGQEFRCGECKGLISPLNSRLCDYSGLYYCQNCHFGPSDVTIIPARIIHNWDFTPRSVSRRSLQIINFLKYKPILFNITELNSMLYGLVEELPQIKVCPKTNYRITWHIPTGRYIRIFFWRGRYIPVYNDP